MAQKNILVGKASTTVSSVIGNVTSLVKSHFTSAFPKGFFKSFYVDTSLSSLGFGAEDGKEDAVTKNRTPRLAISPKYDLTTDTSFRVYPEWYKAHRYVYKDTRANYRRVLYNDRDGYYIYSIPTRLKLSFDIRIKVQSNAAAMNLAHFIHQSFDVGGYYFLNKIKLESEVPKVFVKALMDDMGIDPKDPAQLKTFYEYLQNFSAGMITEKTNLSSGLPMYSYVYGANVLCAIEGPPQIETSERNQTKEYSTVSLTMTAELWVPASFVMETEKMLEAPDPEDPISSDSTTITISYTLRSEPERVLDDKQIIFWTGYVADANVTVDVLPLSSVISPQVAEIIKYNVENSVDNYSMFDVVVYQDDNKLVKGTDFTMDWSKLELNTIDPFPNMTYHVGVYGNMPKLVETWEKIAAKMAEGEEQEDGNTP